VVLLFFRERFCFISLTARSADLLLSRPWRSMSAAITGETFQAAAMVLAI